MAWNDLELPDKARMIKLAVDSGITDLRTIREVYNKYAEGGPLSEKEKQELIDRINNTSDANFVERLKDKDRAYIQLENNEIATHRMGYANDDGRAVVFPDVQEVNGKLIDFGRVPYARNAAIENAIETGDTLMMSLPQAEWFTQNYKQYYPFAEGGHLYSGEEEEKSSGFLSNLFKRNRAKEEVSETLAEQLRRTRKQENIKNEAVLPTDLETIARRQYYIESKFKDNAVSGAGAQGAYQIMPITYRDYVKRTGNTGDLNDYDFNRAVRDYYMDRYLNSTWATKENQGPYNKMAKALAAYNWGTGNLLKYLEAQKASGVDIYGSKDWISGLPAETRNYIKWILDGEDIGKATTNEAFEAAKAVRFPPSEAPIVRIVNNIPK